jgi:CRISPR-associated protein Cas2
MFIVVAYDLPDDRRRTRLHKALKHFGTPVQESVFECFLSPRQLEQMKQVIARIFDDRTDHVRFYYLCEACYRRNEATRASRRTSDPKAVIL